jgi:thymidine phosphorylase
MVAVGRRLGVPTATLITDMNQPLGRMAGNAVEVNEAVDVLRGDGPAEVRELAVSLGAEALVAAGEADSQADAQRRLSQLLDSGRALDKFRDMVAAQGGDLDAARPVAPASVVTAARAGVIQSIDAEALGYALIELGGGRKVKSDVIDHSVGIEMLVRLGNEVERGQPLVRVFAKPQAADVVRGKFERAVTIGDEPVQPPPLIVERVA